MTNATAEMIWDCSSRCGGCPACCPACAIRGEPCGNHGPLADARRLLVKAAPELARDGLFSVEALYQSALAMGIADEAADDLAYEVYTALEAEVFS